MRLRCEYRTLKRAAVTLESYPNKLLKDLQVSLNTEKLCLEVKLMKMYATSIVSESYVIIRIIT
jgi:hypothetical protein